MLALSLRRTPRAAISAARAFASQRFVSISAPKHAETVVSVKKEVTAAPAFGKTKAAAKSNSRLSPAPVKGKGPAPATTVRKTVSLLSSKGRPKIRGFLSAKGRRASKVRPTSASSSPFKGPRGTNSVSTQGRRKGTVPVLAKDRRKKVVASGRPSKGRKRIKRRFDPAIVKSRNTRRPQISLSNPRVWNRPIAEGVLPAYDEALKIMKRDSEDLTEEARQLAKQIARLEAEIVAKEKKKQPEELNEMLEKLESLRKKYQILSVQSLVNLPSVRWMVANAQVDPSNLAHLHLAEQRWRGRGSLDLLMERLHQMHVVPDLLPGIHPSLDLHITVQRRLAAQFRRNIKTRGKDHLGVEPGTFVFPSQTAQPPRLWAHAFHRDVRLYTMVMIDPDVPDVETRSFTTYLHWMKPNIPISALSRPRALISPSLLNSHTFYVPPHPQQGTPYHRYTILLLPQPAKTVYSLNVEARFLKELNKHNELSAQFYGGKKVISKSSAAESVEKSHDPTLLPVTAPSSWPLSLLKQYTTSQWLNIPTVKDSERRGFDLRQFIRQWGLAASDNLTMSDVGGTGLGGGISGQSLPALRAQVNGGKGVRKSGNNTVIVGGGAHMFREVWDESVPGMFEASVPGGMKEEKYAVPKKADPYEGVKGTRKYI